MAFSLSLPILSFSLSLSSTYYFFEFFEAPANRIKRGSLETLLRFRISGQYGPPSIRASLSLRTTQLVKNLVESSAP